MAEAGAALVRRAYEVFDTDLDGLLKLLDPEIDWVSPAEGIEPGPRHGHDGVKEAFAATAMAWDDPTHTPKEFVDAGGGHVLVAVTFRGHGRASGMEAERSEFHVWTVGDEAISRFQWFYDKAAARKAAGLDPPD
jgi:ketosteroid isomerase-like protein